MAWVKVYMLNELINPNMHTFLMMDFSFSPCELTGRQVMSLTSTSLVLIYWDKDTLQTLNLKQLNQAIFLNGKYTMVFHVT